MLSVGASLVLCRMMLPRPLGVAPLPLPLPLPLARLSLPETSAHSLL